MSKTFEVCARCGYSREKHELGNYTDGAQGVGRAFLVCPNATWKTETVTLNRKKRNTKSKGQPA